MSTDPTPFRPGQDPHGVLGDTHRLLATSPHSPQVECGPGWHILVAETMRRLLEIDPNLVVDQIKEKFARLSIYVDPSPDIDADPQRSRQFRQTLRDAETVSGWICEVCGRADGRQRRDPLHHQTLCDEHAAR